MIQGNYGDGKYGFSNSLYSGRASSRNSYSGNSGNGRMYDVNRISLSYDGENDYEIL